MTRSLDVSVCERLTLFVSESRRIKRKRSPYRLAFVPAAPHKIQELFLLELRLTGREARAVELDEPVGFDVLLPLHETIYLGTPNTSP
jgi:hypothetical protein